MCFNSSLIKSKYTDYSNKCFTVTVRVAYKNRKLKILKLAIKNIMQRENMRIKVLLKKFLQKVIFAFRLYVRFFFLLIRRNKRKEGKFILVNKFLFLL